MLMGLRMESDTFVELYLAFVYPVMKISWSMCCLRLKSNIDNRLICGRSSSRFNPNDITHNAK